MKSMAQIGDAALKTWAYVIHACGEMDPPPDPPGIRGHGEHGNPVEAAAIRALTHWDRRIATRVDDYLREYRLSRKPDAGRISVALTLRYVGTESVEQYGYSVHGIAYRRTHRPAANYHEVARRMGITDNAAKGYLWRGKVYVGKMVGDAARVARGQVGEVVRGPCNTLRAPAYCSYGVALRAQKAPRAIHVALSAKI